MKSLPPAIGVALVCAALPAAVRGGASLGPSDIEPLAPRVVDVCGDDVKRLCPEIKPGSGRVSRCLREHESELGEPCREKLQEDIAKARRFIRDFGQACRTDVDRYCPTVEPGGGRVLGCLSQHLLDLSSPCQAEIGRIGDARDRIAAVRKACAVDVERICSRVPAQAGPLLDCLETSETLLSPECRASDFRAAAQAAVVVDQLEEMTRQENVREVLEILQGLDSVAFSRSQILLQFDSYQSLLAQANGGRLLFNPQFVFGNGSEFALQVKVPVTALYPYAPGAPTQYGLGAVTTAFAWNFDGTGSVRQYLSLGLQWQTASSPPVGGPWALVPAYAVGTALARWLSFTTQVVWIRSFGSTSGYPKLSVLYVEPIFAANLPGRAYVALDTRLGWDFVSGTFVPLMKGLMGLFTDRQKSLSVSAWYQATLSGPAASEFYKYEIGMGLAYFFDW
ncbi:MAG TPA: cysteine rich repeat-containing protein [Anaeromyxobacteraceae bacterium]|nr:cysteine rich repeat-containing protein [Anaeromyxobacteraceae bacterium]